MTSHERNHSLASPANSSSFSPLSLQIYLSLEMNHSPVSNSILISHSLSFSIIHMYYCVVMKILLTFLSSYLSISSHLWKKWFGSKYLYNQQSEPTISLTIMLPYLIQWFYALFECFLCKQYWVHDPHVFHSSPITPPNDDIALLLSINQLTLIIYVLD